jgi:hypothetical protein
MTYVFMAVLIAALAPSAAGATEANSNNASTISDVDFGDCTELATGSVVALSELQDRVPDEVPVLSLTDQGIVFPGSDDLGVVITRVLDCDSITVTHDGKTRTQEDRHVAHIGTAVDASALPASPFSYDGVNSADFNNYTFGYYSDSSIFRNAMRRADIQPIAPARIDMVDVTVEECVVDRTVTVQPQTGPQNNYGFTAHGIVPLAACEPSVVPFIGNWWSVKDGVASVLSNNIAGQSAIFLTPADTTITIVPGRNSQLTDIFGADSATADAFGFSGFIPENPASTEIITIAGLVGAATE